MPSEIEHLKSVLRILNRPDLGQVDAAVPPIQRVTGLAASRQQFQIEILVASQHLHQIYGLVQSFTVKHCDSVAQK
jgi:hypothetical protein